MSSFKEKSLSLRVCLRCWIKFLENVLCSHLGFVGNLAAQKVEIPPSQLTEAYAEDDAQDEQSMDGDVVEAYDQTIDGQSQRYVPLHENAEDVTIVAAQAGFEDTDWISEFCEEQYKTTPLLFLP